MVIKKFSWVLFASLTIGMFAIGPSHAQAQRISLLTILSRLNDVETDMADQQLEIVDLQNLTGDLQTQVDGLQAQLDGAEVFRTFRSLYDRRETITNGFLSGSFRRVPFTKRNSGTTLRVTYSDNFQVVSANRAASWSVYLDGQFAPYGNQRIKMTIQNGNGTGVRRQGTLIGYFNNVPAGNHTIQVFVSSSSTSVLTGEDSTFLLQVEEMKREN